MQSKFGLPWIEKYRPQTLDEIIDHCEKIKTLKSMISSNEMTHLIFYGMPGTGKCRGKGTEILMADGNIKTVEDVVVGDTLMGDDSKSRLVKSICHGYEQMYQIVPEYGKPWTCNSSHILCLKKQDSSQVVEISVKDYINSQNRDDYLMYRTSVQFSEQSLSGDPYALALQLSTNNDPDVTMDMKYKINSEINRMKALAGLIDGRGYIDDKRCYHFMSISKHLLNDFIFLTQSLGFRIVSKTDKTAVIDGFNLHHIPVIKQYNRPSSTPIYSAETYDTFKFIVRIIDNDHYYGFTLVGNGRFLLGDFTVTHNTSMILACAREIYGEHYGRYILELNASDDRGIETVRKKIPDFVRTTCNKIRLVILDEVDAMTNDAQSALRRVIEKYSKNSRFCLICNNINKIIPGLQSRCTKMRFGYLNSNEISHKLMLIIEQEGVKITPEALTRLISFNKDFRQILNTLQCLHIIKLTEQSADYQPIEVEQIDHYLGIPTDQGVNQIIKMMFTTPLYSACGHLVDSFKDNQWGLPDLIHKLAEIIIKDNTLKQKQQYYIIDRLSDIESKISHCNDSEIQLYALVSAFQQSLLIK